jgi:hypothetical protein
MSNDSLIVLHLVYLIAAEGDEEGQVRSSAHDIHYGSA